MILLPFCHLGWVSKDKWGQKEDKNKATTYVAQSKTGFHVTLKHNIHMVHKLFCFTTFGVSFLELQLRKYAAELENTRGSQKGLAHKTAHWHQADSRLCLTTSDIHYHSLDTKNMDLVPVILLPFKFIYVLGWFPSMLAAKMQWIRRLHFVDK